MIKEIKIDEKIYEVEGLPVSVFIGLSSDRRTLEIQLISGDEMDALHIAKILEVVSSDFLKDVKVPVQSYAKDMN